MCKACMNMKGIWHICSIEVYFSPSNDSASVASDWFLSYKKLSHLFHFSSLSDTLMAPFPTKGFLRKVGKFFRSYSDLLSICYGRNFSVFYGDLVNKLRRVRCEANFVSSGSKIVKRLLRRKYDPLIIERTKGLVLGPSTALYRSFLKHCTLTYKAVGTIWPDLSKPRPRSSPPMLVLLITQLLRLVGRLGSRKNRFNHTILVTIVTPTDRPKSVRNRCVIEVFGVVFVLSRCFLDFSCRCRGFCYRTESDLFLFLFNVKYKRTDALSLWHQQ